ncbi:MAG TPA: hypothetical protein VEJ37_09185 [Xanthobacteraceae bacterium]|nr:hypothetical protein [Xanthobacteraceae bacterium]
MDSVKRDDWATLAPWAALIGVLVKTVNAGRVAKHPAGPAKLGRRATAPC